MRWLHALGLIIGLSLELSGCAGIVKELASDSAVVGVTGFWMSIGASPSPASPTPIPGLTVGYGTVWRIGKHDEVTVKVNSAATATEGGAQLEIKAKDNPR